jgi:hypothetical protein
MLSFGAPLGGGVVVASGCFHRLNGTVQVMSITALHVSFQERAKPSLHARCYLRLGLYEWHHADAAEQHLAHCMDLLRVSETPRGGGVQGPGGEGQGECS